MSDRTSNVDILDLSLDEYTRLYVRTDFKRKASGRRPAQQNYNYHRRRRGAQSHYDEPACRRHQRDRLQEKRLSVSQNACIKKLRMEQKRLQQKSLQEMHALQQRLRVQRQKPVSEVRELQLRHRQQHVALQKLIDEKQRESVQYLIDENVDRAQGVGKSELIHKQELNFEITDDTLSTEDDDTLKEVLEPEDDIDSDMLYIPTSFSLNEYKLLDLEST